MRPINRQKEADRAKWLLSLPGGDHLTLLNAYNQYHQSNLLHLSHFDRVMSYALISPPSQISTIASGRGTTTSRSATSSKPIMSACNSNESWNGTTFRSYQTSRILNPKHNSTRTYGGRYSPDSSCRSLTGIQRRKRT